jgi:hypothetical protein
VGLFAAGQAGASAISPNQWYEFSAIGGVIYGCPPADPGAPNLCGLGVDSEFAPAPAWEITLGDVGTLIVTDGFSYGDQFDVFDNGFYIGSTSLVAIQAVGCGNNPVACLADPASSSAIFALGAGSHSITIQQNQGGNAAAFFRVEPIPEPSAVALFGVGSFLVHGALRRRRRT